MSAVAISAPIPLFQEANTYWQELMQECQRQMDAINAILARQGVPADDRITWTSGQSLRMSRSQLPSTRVEFNMQFYPWGPMISGTVTGDQAEDLKFAPEEFDFVIAKDLDGAVVAIIGEGRSLCPREVALFLTQNFRRCFPCISLPL
ncbi:MAG TPA: hypothetical protein VLI55_13625 [Bryobacteraceae bacterium]|nr:hypothetical protein [Bryobacteraceae bacterium]